MLTQYQTVLQAFEELGKSITIREMEEYMRKKHGDVWKDFGTVMADMVSINYSGNPSSNVPNEYRVLKRVSRGKYALIQNEC